MQYPQNFVIRLIICIVGMFALWMAVQFITDVLIRQEAFALGPIDFIVPLGCGIAEAFLWKPKEKK